MEHMANISSLFLCRAEGAVNDKGSKERSTLNRYMLREASKMWEQGIGQTWLG